MHSLLQGICCGAEVGTDSGAFHSVFLPVGMPLFFLAETCVSGTICSQRRGKPKHPPSEIPVIQFKHSKGTRRAPSGAAPSMNPNDSFFDAILFIRTHTAADKSQVPTRTQTCRLLKWACQCLPRLVLLAHQFGQGRYFGLPLRLLCTEDLVTDRLSKRAAARGAPDRSVKYQYHEYSPRNTGSWYGERGI